jgi:hypothetical protein
VQFRLLYCDLRIPDACSTIHSSSALIQYDLFYNLLRAGNYGDRKTQYLIILNQSKFIFIFSETAVKFNHTSGIDWSVWGISPSTAAASGMAVPRTTALGGAPMLASL